MPKAQKTIIVGRGKLNDFFYMVNDETEYGEPWYQGSSKEKEVRSTVKPKVFASQLSAKPVLDQLKREVWDTRWWTEPYTN